MTAPPTTRPTTAVLEADWMISVGQALSYCGWRWVHHRPGRTAAGWRTAVQGSGAKGLPDVLAIRPPRVLFLELKTARGRTSPEQQDWIAALKDSGQEAHFVTLPREWDFLMKLIRRDPQQMTLKRSDAERGTISPAPVRWRSITGGTGNDGDT